MLGRRADRLAHHPDDLATTASRPLGGSGQRLQLHLPTHQRAQAAGLVPRWGRKVLEIRPPVDADKGVAVRTLLFRSGAARGFYAGDDTTDIDAFAGLRKAGLEHAVGDAVASEEGPGELREAADLVVESPEAFTELLRHL